MTKPIAIIPARGGSKRFPRKNVAELNGKPLISYGIKTALESGIFEQVIVSSEDDEIRRIAQEYQAEVYCRSDELATDTAHELDACAEILDAVQARGSVPPPLFCVIYPTAVLVTADDLRRSFERISEVEEAGALMCVSGFNYHPYKALRERDGGWLEMMFPEHCLQRSQTYPHLTASNGTFYWLRTAVFGENREKGYYQDKLVSYEIEAERAIDIDYPEDLKKVESYLTLNKDR